MPWFLTYSHSLADVPAKRITGYYAARIQIEESLRDMKSHQFGLGFECNATRAPERLANLVLISSLTLFALWIIGCWAEQKNLSPSLQSNTEKRRRVYALTTLGQLVILCTDLTFTVSRLTPPSTLIREYHQTTHSIGDQKTWGDLRVNPSFQTTSMAVGLSALTITAVTAAPSGNAVPKISGWPTILPTTLGE